MLNCKKVVKYVKNGVHTTTVTKRNGKKVVWVRMIDIQNIIGITNCLIQQ